MDEIQPIEVRSPEPTKSDPPAETLEVPSDPAAAAFEALREEVALVRRAVGGLAAERAAIEIPDYRETLANILQANVATAKRLRALVEAPALQMSASRWAHEIAAAGEIARRNDHDELRRACNAFQSATSDLRAAVGAARTEERQRTWLIRTGAASLLAGMALSALIAWTLLPTSPASRQMPEQRAAAILGMSDENAGEHLLQTASPRLWQDLVFGDRLVIANRAALNRCLQNGRLHQNRTEHCVIEIPAGPP